MNKEDILKEFSVGEVFEMKDKWKEEWKKEYRKIGIKMGEQKAREEELEFLRTYQKTKPLIKKEDILQKRIKELSKLQGDGKQEVSHPTRNARGEKE